MELSGQPLEKTAVGGGTLSGSYWRCWLSLGGPQPDQQQQRCWMASTTLTLARDESPRPRPVDGRTMTIVTKRTQHAIDDSCVNHGCSLHEFRVEAFGATVHGYCSKPTSGILHMFFKRVWNSSTYERIINIGTHSYW